MREGMTKQERERLEKLDAIKQQTNFGFVRETLEDPPLRPIYYTPPPKPPKDDKSWLDDVLSESAQGTAISCIIFLSIVGGTLIGLFGDRPCDSVVLSIIVIIVALFVLLWFGFLTFIAVVVCPIKALIKAVNKCDKPLSIGDAWRRLVSLDGKTLAVIGAIILLILIILLWFFPIPRYTTMHGNGEYVVAVQYDRWTGKSYIVYRSGSRRQIEDESGTR